MTDWIATTVTSTRGWNHLETLVDIENRLAGTVGEEEAARVTGQAFTAVGARNVRLEEFPLQGWERRTSSISAIDADVSLECIALPRSPSQSTTGDLVDLGYGLPPDFEENDVSGKIVQVASNAPSYFDRPLHRREKYRLAVENDAAGFVFRNHAEGGLAPTGSLTSSHG